MQQKGIDCLVNKIKTYRNFKKEHFQIMKVLYEEIVLENIIKNNIPQMVHSHTEIMYIQFCLFP